MGTELLMVDEFRLNAAHSSVEISVEFSRRRNASSIMAAGVVYMSSALHEESMVVKVEPTPPPVELQPIIVEQQQQQQQTPSPSTTTTKQLSIRQVAITALRSNSRPALVLQLFALTILICYFLSSTFERVCDDIGDFKARSGYLFSAVSTAIFGGCIPYIILQFRVIREAAASPLVEVHSWRYIVGHGVYFTVLWGLIGCQVDAFYRLQAVMFGNDASFTTLVYKVLVDQFIYNPFWGVFSTTIPYRFEEMNFNITATIRSIRHRDYMMITYPSTLLSVWIVWLPIVTMVYMLPSSLQIPFFNLAVCFSSLVLSLLVRQNNNNNNNNT